MVAAFCFGSGEIPFHHRRASEARDRERYKIAEIKPPNKSTKVDVPSQQHCRLPFHRDWDSTIDAARVAASMLEDCQAAGLGNRISKRL